mmetsp:Transcript_104382/g.319609  ORF Transcript_104382/g.319609 Transcript_104382/m.319609 type:complete len:271 (-) Transcript_104382:1285-2097(-)
MHSADTFSCPKPFTSNTSPHAVWFMTTEHLQLKSPPKTWQKLDDGSMSSQGGSGCVGASQFPHEVLMSSPRARSQWDRNAISDRCTRVMLSQSSAKYGSAAAGAPTKMSHISTAPAWWGIMPRTKSSDGSQLYLRDMPCIIMWFASMNPADEEHVRLPQPMDMFPWPCAPWAPWVSVACPPSLHRPQVAPQTLLTSVVPNWFSMLVPQGCSWMTVSQAHKFPHVHKALSASASTAGVEHSAGAQLAVSLCPPCLSHNLMPASSRSCSALT